MNAFEYAMKMEADGKKYYEEQAAALGTSVLRKIYEELAGDEQRHYEIFKAMHAGADVDINTAFKSNVLATAKNIFQDLSDNKQKIKDFPTGVKEAWEKARAIEDKSEKFYREQAGKAADEIEKAMWLKIAGEEHNHWVALDNVIQFIDHPNQWIEDAEWSHKKD